MSEGWRALTVATPPLLEEILGALRDAQIEHRLSDPERDLPQTGARTRFGGRAAGTRAIEVPAAELARAQAILQGLFAEAEAAAVRQAGGAPATLDEQDEERRWRQEQIAKQARVDRRIKIFVWSVIVLVAGAVLAGLILK